MLKKKPCAVNFLVCAQARILTLAAVVYFSPVTFLKFASVANDSFFAYLQSRRLHLLFYSAGRCVDAPPLDRIVCGRRLRGRSGARRGGDGGGGGGGCSSGGRRGGGRRGGERTLVVYRI